jgi:phosphoribosylformimino-5-aminoimidazole carboxamide ribotide isomerase
VVSIEQIRPELTWRLRQRVLYPAKKLYEVEMDEDNHGYHFGAFSANELVAVVSLFQNGNDCQFRKFAVDADMQGKGVGNQLLQYITDFAVKEGAQCLWCNARTTAIGFYLKNGFEPTGKLFTQNGFDYEIVEKKL